jgi:hypothetical protein
VGFRQRRFPRGMAVDLALGIGVTLARGIGLALRGPPLVARRCFGGGRGLQFGLGGFQRLALEGCVDAGLLEFVFDVDQARTFGKTSRRA